jgi:hypothetical protein
MIRILQAASVLVLIIGVFDRGLPFLLPLGIGALFLLFAIDALMTGEVGSKMGVFTRDKSTFNFYFVVLAYLAFAVFMLFQAYKLTAP